jgi:hypothetical protein
LHEYAYLISRSIRSEVLLPDHRNEMRARTVHYSEVRKHVIVVVRLDSIDQELEVRMPLFRAHNVISQSHLDLCRRHPRLEW